MKYTPPPPNLPVILNPRSPWPRRITFIVITLLAVDGTHQALIHLRGLLGI